MDHDEAVRQKATERYLLDELDAEIRDQFEEHLFDCLVILRTASTTSTQVVVLTRHCKHSSTCCPKGESPASNALPKRPTRANP